MENIINVRRFLESANGSELLAIQYGGDDGVLNTQRLRYAALAERFAAQFPQRRGMAFFSSPGRAEIGGNHTDHQAGRVLAAAVNLDTLAAAAANHSMLVHVHSEGYPPIALDLAELVPVESERGTSAAAIRGCAARMKTLGYAIGGFDAVMTSDVLSGSGLSSSAAFEVLICAIFDGLFGNGDMPAPLRAQISQYAENVFFDKPSGLMDQMASSVGGLVAIDFESAEKPLIQAISYDFFVKGYALAVVNTRGGHDDLTPAYAAIPREMEQVAAFFGQKKLRSVDRNRFEAEIPKLRSKVSDRAILRAMHFFDENERVAEQVSALLADDSRRFLELIVDSGMSSLALLQNLNAHPEEQPLPLALELSRRMLAGRGAWRVHGGGFAGTILAFVPLDMMENYRGRMDAVFGQGACQTLRIRPLGPMRILFD